MVKFAKVEVVSRPAAIVSLRRVYTAAETQP